MRALASLFLAVALSANAQTHDAKRAIETNLATRVAIEGVGGKSLEQRMRELGVPAVSFAVVDNGRIVLAAAYGLADVEEKRPATPRTLFQAASLSKPVTALAVLDLVERGRISLDTPVNDLLTTWKLPDNDFTAAMPVTLRLLLSHTAGTTVHGFPGYASDAERPTLMQVLEGKTPANTKAIVVDLAPNTKFRYSGGGTTLAQAALADHLRIDFPELMRRTVFQPLGMTSSTYEQPLPRSRRAEAASAYNAGVRAVDGKWHVYPEMAAAGLWTTPSDLAKVIIDVQEALAGRPAKLLSIDGARHMLTPRMTLSPTTSVGIGFFVEERRGQQYFTHGGANEGFRSTILGSLDGRRGVVVMTNSDTGSALQDEIVATVGREFGWPGFANAPLKRGTIADATPFAGRFQLDEPKEVVSIRRAGDAFEIVDLTRGWTPLYALEDGTLARTDRDVRYAIAPEGLTVISGPKRSLARRLPADSVPSADEFLASGQTEAALAAYRAQTPPPEEQMLNSGGYTLIAAGRIAQALALLQLATELYPASSNTWDSLADASMIAGDDARAIAATEEQLRRIDADPALNSETRTVVRRVAEGRLKKLRK
jgi:CubicO group peptidase (beta-lactamase class C family)